MKVRHVDGALIDTACSRAREHLPEDDAAQAEEFIRQYYRWVAPEDIAERSPLDVYGLEITRPTELEATLDQIPGVVTNGLFARRPADVLLLGTSSGVQTLSR